MSGRSQIFCWGCSHRTAATPLRDQLTLSLDAQSELLRHLQSEFGLSEVVLLSTCNRFEVYGVHPAESVAFPEQLLNVLRKRMSLDQYLVADQAWGQVFYYHLDVAAVTHAMNVCSSMDSLVLGETQITGQFKDSFALAKGLGSLGPILVRLEQEALAVTKIIRTQTALGRRSVSVGSAAVDLVKLVFGQIHRHEVLLIGAGEMARLSAQHLMKYRPKALHVVNRSYGRAVSFAESFEGALAAEWELLPRLLDQVDVVISATGAMHTVVSKEMVTASMLRRKGRTLCLVDIAMPRDIDAQVSSLEGVYAFDIDDLQQVVETHQSGRQEALKDAVLLVQNASQSFMKWMAQASVRPVLGQVGSYLGQLLAQEQQRSLSKQVFSDLSSEQKLKIEAMLQAIQKRFIADLSTALKSDHPHLSREQMLQAWAVLTAADGSSAPRKDDNDLT